MSARRQLPVYSPISASVLGSAVWPLIRGGASPVRRVASQLRAQYETPRVVLTNSGTSALILALRAAVGPRGVVAMPGYTCVDLAAAARFAHVHVRVYDLDPHTLSPAIASLEAAVARGVNAILVAHLYGYPGDMESVAKVAERAGVPIIEDAAQGNGALYRGRPLGTYGALSVLSFGRGKGVTGGNGGALLVNHARFDESVAVAASKLGGPSHGWHDWLAASGQFAFGRPALYGIPSRIPMLHLGEMVYHPAHEPRSISASAATLVMSALKAAPRELAVRQRVAAALATVVDEGGDIEAISVVEQGRGGFLRYPVLDFGERVPRPELGILRGYPRTLMEQDEMRPCLMNGEPSTPGSELLRRALFTLPTHRLVGRTDLASMIDWLRVPTRRVMPIVSANAHS